MTISAFLKTYSTNNTPLRTLDAEVLLAHVLAKPREFLIEYPDYKLRLWELIRALIMVMRRMRGEPVAYLVGHKEFYDLDLNVNHHVLIPRPETELLVDEALARVNEWSAVKGQLSIVDVGTGSGAIIISLAKSLINSSTHQLPSFFATDSSAPALRVAKYNAVKYGLSEKITFLKGNLLAPARDHSISSSLDNCILVANLPYLTRNEMKESSIRFEPRSALYGGADGLDAYRKLLKQLATNQIRPAACIFEINPEQGAGLQKLVSEYLPGYSCEIKKDYCDLDRIAVITK